MLIQEPMPESAVAFRPPVLVPKSTLMAGPEERAEWLGRAPELSRVVLSERSTADLECLATGAFSPLEGFMDRADYECVLTEMRLISGAAWPLPVTLPLDDDQHLATRRADNVVLASPGGRPLAILQLRDIFEYDKQVEARHVFRSEDQTHPGVAMLNSQADHLASGKLIVLDLPSSRAFEKDRLKPAQVRERIKDLGWQTVCGFHTRYPSHRSHEYVTKCALELVDGLLFHPSFAEARADDLPVPVRMAGYKALISTFYPANRAILSVFPGATRFAGPREAVFHALCRRNYGCTHFIVGRDHAAVGSYYGSFESHQIFAEFTPAELGVIPVLLDHPFWCRICAQMATAKTCPHAPEERVALSGTEVRGRLASGEPIPHEFSRPQIVEVLRDALRRSG
ncbi:MAG: sulfate adenylyltransferase [Actinomycetota bacterium]